MPLTNLAIIRNGNNRMRVLCSNNPQRINGHSMTIFRQNRFLNRSSFSSNIPLNNITRLSSSNNNIRKKGIKYSFCNLILASKGNLRSRFQIKWKYVNKSIRFIKPIFITLTIRNQQKFRDLWTPINRSDSSFHLNIRLKNKIICNLISPLLFGCSFLIFLNEKITNHIKFRI